MVVRTEIYLTDDNYMMEKYLIYWFPTVEKRGGGTFFWPRKVEEKFICFYFLSVFNSTLETLPTVSTSSVFIFFFLNYSLLQLQNSITESKSSLAAQNTIHASSMTQKSKGWSGSREI